VTTNPEKKICPRILIVDDDPDHCQLVHDALMTYYRIGPDSRTVMVHTGEDCLRQDLKDFDIILLDLHLPDKPGLTVLQEVLARADLPVVFVTGDQDLAMAMKAVENGAQDYVVKHGDYLLAIPPIIQKNLGLHQIKLEHDRLQLRLKWMLDELQHKNEQLEESMEKLRELAISDPLTGLANRRYFGEQLARQFNEALRYGVDLSCCMVDLDHYKQFNDTLGHQMGDQLLEMTAAMIRSSLRGADIAARYGGDEFVLLLPQTGAEEAQAVIKRIRQMLELEFQRDSRLSVPVTLSAGVASLKEDHPNTADELVSMADMALYRAKDLGKDRVVVYTAMKREVEQLQ
jgi:diguanylate cyclase (GGDEF)-like protein